MPTEWKPSASTPGRMPTPSASTKMIAKTRSGIDRHSTMIPRASQRIAGCGVVFRAARNPTMTPSTADSAVPTMAMQTVMRAWFRLCGKAVKLGGTVWPRNLKMFPIPENSGVTPMPM
jgi:hypothetical protein